MNDTRQQPEENGENLTPGSNIVSELEDKISDLTAGWQRTQADFVNYKNQVAKEKSQLIKVANANLIESLLPVMDNFALAAKHLPKELENNVWAGGVRQIEKQLENVLRDEGLERIKTLGVDFDPALHEAIDQVESELPVGEIVEELSTGYTLDSIVIKPARVKVSKGKAKKNDK